jgi:hypothetical protein
MIVPFTKKPSDYRSEKLHILHGVEATENQILKICVDWEIKHLVKKTMTSSTNFNLVVNIKPASAPSLSSKSQ